MPHTSLINELCRQAGVVWDDTEELFQPWGMIDISLKKIRRRGVIQNNAEEVPIPLQIQNSSPPRQEHTMDDRMTAMDRSLERHRQELDAHRRQVEEHMRYARFQCRSEPAVLQLGRWLHAFPTATYLAVAIQGCWWWWRRHGPRWGKRVLKLVTTGMCIPALLSINAHWGQCTYLSLGEELFLFYVYLHSRSFFSISS